MSFFLSENVKWPWKMKPWPQGASPEVRLWDKWECEHQTARFCLGVLWNLKYDGFHLYSLWGFISLSSFVSLHLTSTTFILPLCSLASPLPPSWPPCTASCHPQMVPKLANGANPHLPLHLQSLPSRKQDTQKAERALSCRETKMTFREQKAQRKPLLWAEWDPWHKRVLYKGTVLLHCNKAKKVRGLLLLRNIFQNEHAIELPVIEGVRWKAKVIPSRWKFLCYLSHIISTHGFAVWDFMAETKLSVSLLF